MDALLDAFSAAHPAADPRTIERAYTVAAHAHRGQTRKSGDPFISHPIAVATIVTEFGMSPEVVCAALLHDTVEYAYASNIAWRAPVSTARSTRRRRNRSGHA